MQLVYFAWVRERIGLPQETWDSKASTVAALLEELRGRGEPYATTLSDPNAIRIALDQELVTVDASLDGVREVAIFPPMTGG